MTSTKVRVWDLPTRLFHWALVVCVIGLVITGNVGGNAMPWHFRFGFMVLSLLLFRAVWGLVGGRWSRFASFIYSPRSILNYIRGQAPSEHTVGHNPLGAGSVFALLAFLAAQVATGLFSDDEIAATGPLSKFVSNATVSLVTGYHKNVGKVVLLVLILLHIAAIVYYRVKKKENLVRPMLTGDKELAFAVEPSRDDAASRVGALVLLVACGTVVNWLVSLGG